MPVVTLKTVGDSFSTTLISDISTLRDDIGCFDMCYDMLQALTGCGVEFVDIDIVCAKI